MNIYERMQPAFTTRKDLDQLINAYIKNGTMYRALTHSAEDDKVVGMYYLSYKDEFYKQIYNDWKKSINILSRNNWVKEEYLDQIHALDRYLKTQNPQTSKEILQIIDYERVKGKTLKDAVESFRWDSIGEYSGWEHIHSNKVNYGLSKKQTIRHRLYINCDSTVTYRIMTRFIQKCNAERQSYYFKFDDVGGRDDTIVFYSDTKHLEKYIKYLTDIIKEEHFEQNMHKPPLCTSKINTWIGYGTDPKKGEDKVSFNDLRAKHLETCINEETYNWISNNLYLRFRLNGKEITYKEYLIRKIANTIKERYMKFIKDTDTMTKLYGYNLSDLKSVNLEAIISRAIETHFNQILEYFKTGKMQAIEIPFKKGTIKIDGFYMSKARIEQVGFIYNNSENYRRNLLNRIKDTAINFGIDKDNYGCDLYVVEELGKNRKPSITNVNITSNATTDTTKKAKQQPRRGRMLYKPMTDEEIEESRKKLGFI